jgi:tetratricopeptide (TPR) repeat protein
MLWEKIGSTKNLLGLYHHTGSHDKIFNIYELENNVEKALKYLETLKIDNNQLIAEGEELLRNHRYFLALTHFLAVERGKFNAAQEPGPGTNVDSLSILRRKIADCYYKMGKYETSILYYQNIGDFYSAARIYSEMGDYVNTFCMYYDSDQDQLDGFAKARKALKKIPNKTFLRKIALDYYYHQDYKRAMFLFKYFKKGFKPLEGICYAISGKKKKAIKKWKQCNSYGEIIIIAEECLGNNLIETGAAFFLDFYFLQVSCHLENFDKALVGSSLVNLMNTYFAPLVDPENIGMDREHLASLKKEARAWGLFIAGHDEDYFQNSMTVHYYLAFCGEYNRLLIYFLKLLKWYPGQSIDIQEVAQRNSPQDRTVFEEEQLFQAILMEKVGKLMEKDRSNLDIYASKITLRKNNYLLLILAPVAEEYHKKAADWCKKNWCKDDLKQYLRLYAPERLKIFKKRSRQNDQKKEK